MPRNKSPRIPIKEDGVRMLYDGDGKQTLPRVGLPDAEQYSQARPDMGPVMHHISHRMIPVKVVVKKSWLEMRNYDIVDHIKTCMTRKLIEALLEDHLIEHFLEVHQDPRTMEDVIKFEANVVIAKPGMSDYRMAIIDPMGPIT